MKMMRFAPTRWLHPGYSGVICPSGGLSTGLSSLFFGFSEKYLFPLTQIRSRTLAVSFHRGAYRDRQRRGMGCGGRGSVRRATWSQGGFLWACERSNGELTNDVAAYGEVVWS